MFNLHYAFTKCSVNRPINIAAKKWYDTLFKVGNNCMVILKHEPIYISRISTPASPVISHEYLMPGIIIDKHLGMFIKDWKIIKEGVIKGDFYGMPVTAKIGFEPKKNVIHIFPSHLYDNFIGGIAADLIPGVMGPLKAMNKMKANLKEGWHSEYSLGEMQKLYCQQSKYVDEIKPGECFFIIGPNLYKLTNEPVSPIYIISELLGLHMIYAHDLQKNIDVLALLKTGYTPTEVDISNLYVRNGLAAVVYFSILEYLLQKQSRHLIFFILL